MAEDLISGYIDHDSFSRDTEFARKELESLEMRFKALREFRKELNTGASGAKQIAEDIQRARVETEQLKQKNLELNAALKEQRLEAAKAAAERRKAAEEEKIRTEEAKQAIRERQVADIEKRRALELQAKKEEELAQIEKKRLQMEKERRDLGTFDIQQGSGQAGPGLLKRNIQEEFIPEQGIQTNILSLAQLKAALKDNIETQKELQKQVKDGTLSQSEYDKSIVSTIEQEQIYRSQIKQTSAEIRAQIDANLAIQGTLDAARKENIALAKERDQIILKGDNVTPEDIARRDELNKLIDQNNELIDKNSDALARQKINIGNYPNAFGSAFKTLNKEMTDLEDKLNSGNFQGDELEQLRMRLMTLQNAAALTGQEFKSVNEQQRAYNEAAKQIGLVYGKNSDIFKQFSKEVGEGNKTVKAISTEMMNASTGAGGLAGGLGRVWSILSRIAFVVPGLGISGFILLMLAPLKALGTAFVDLFKTVDKGKDSIKALNEVNEKAVEIYSKQQAEVSALASVAGDLNQETGTREEALRQLINLSPEYLRGLTLENINTTDGALALERYNEALKMNARLKASQDIFAESEKKLAELKVMTEAFNELTRTGKATYDDLTDEMKKYLGSDFSRWAKNPLRNLFNTKIDNDNIQFFFANVNKEIQKAQRQADSALDAYNQAFTDKLTETGDHTKGLIQKLRDEINDLQKIQPTLTSESEIRQNVERIKKLQDEINKLLGNGGAKNDESLRILDNFHKKNLKAIEDYSRANLLILQDMYKSQISDQKLSEATRLQSLESYLAVSKQLIETDRKAQEDALTSEVSVARRDANKIQNARLRANTLAEIEAYYTNQMMVINQKFSQDITKLDRDTADQRWKITTDAWEKMRADAEQSSKYIRQQQEETYKNIFRQAEIDKYDQLMALQREYQSGSIKSIAEYNTRKAEIEQEANRKQKEAEIERLRVSQAVIKALYGVESLELAKSIKQREYEITERYNDLILKSDQDLLESQRQLRDRQKEFLQQGLESITDAISAQFQRQNDADENRFKKQQEAADRERELIESSTLSEEEKEQRIKMIDERMEAHRDIMENKQRQRAIEQAKMEKAIALLQIGIKTAQAVAGITASAALVRATYAAMGPVGIALGTSLSATILAQIPWVLATAGVQAALIAAKPLPKFKHGKKAGGYEGPAIVGDGGVSEYIVREDGTIEKTPAKDTLTYVGHDDVIFPNLAALLKSAVMPAINGMPESNDNSDLRNEIKSLKPYLNRIASKRELQLQSRGAGMQALWKWGSRQVRYIDQNTNW